MVYYIKQGQRSILKNIKLLENECQISNMTLDTKKKKIEKIVKKIKKKEVNRVVLSREIKENEIFVEMLNNYDITILDGKWLMQYLIQNIIAYLKDKTILQEFDEISLLANDLTNEVKQNIKIIANLYKKIRIVTNHLEKFNKIEQELYQEKGIPIIITNNKRKALLKSTLIVNFDFVQEAINQYNIDENAVIINLNGKIKINRKRFSGVIITDYEVEMQNENTICQTKALNFNDIVEKQKDFSLKEILEEKICCNSRNSLNFNTFEKVKNIFEKYNIKIKELYGISGILSL